MTKIILRKPEKYCTDNRFPILYGYKPNNDILYGWVSEYMHEIAYTSSAKSMLILLLSQFSLSYQTSIALIHGEQNCTHKWRIAIKLGNKWRKLIAEMTEEY